MKISTILDQIDLGSIALPEFQRGYVWNREQVRNLMDSLYRQHPVGSLLVWTTSTKNASTRGDGDVSPGYVKLLLDGQQRMTSLYGIVRGKPPKFFDGNEKSFLDLYFNLDDEIFEFYGPLKMKDNPLWVNVTNLMQQGIADQITQLQAKADGKLETYINRLNNIISIKDRELHIEEVTGEEKTVEVVVDIFNRVNSGGTKLSKGDLALAKICAEWPQARDEMKKRLDKWRRHNFHFKLEWLLRCVNTVLTGEALFIALKNVQVESFEKALYKTEDHIDYILNLISSRLGLDHDKVIGSKLAIPLMARFVNNNDGVINEPGDRDKLLYWYIHTMLWGRYTSSVESILNQDLDALEGQNGSLDNLINLLRQNRGDLKINSSDFIGWSRGARFYPLLYMLSRVWKSIDWETGIELSKHMLGKQSQLHIHHIFPKSVLYDNGYLKKHVNALANYTFLSASTNIKVSNRKPEDYLPEYMNKDPQLLESHWIPLDEQLWKIENYHDFLSERQKLLANAANDFLESLYKGTTEVEGAGISIFERDTVTVPGGIESEEEEQLIKECNDWVVDHGLPEGEYMYELTNDETGELLAIVDIAWPDGIQEGLSEPVALLLNESKETEELVNRAGYKFFVDVDEFKKYVKSNILATV